MKGNFMFEGASAEDPKHLENQMNVFLNHKDCVCTPPTEIGNIIYYDSNQWKNKSDMNKGNKRFIWGILVVLILIALGIYMGGLGGYLLSLVFAGILIEIYVMTNRFRGMDFYIGDKGFAILEFNKSRSNIIKSHSFLFSDVDFLTLGETEVFKSDGNMFSSEQYEKTEYCLALWKMTNEKETVNLIHKVKGNYSQETPGQSLIGNEYRFWNEVERIWTNIQVSAKEELKEKYGNIPFYMVGLENNKGIAKPLFAVGDNYIQLKSDYKCYVDNIKELSINDGFLFMRTTDSTSNQNENIKISVGHISEKLYFVKLILELKDKYNIPDYK